MRRVSDNSNSEVNSTSSTGTSSRAVKIIAAIFLMFSIIGLTVLNFAGFGSRDNKVTLCFVGFDRDTVIPNSFQAALSKAGFDTDNTLWDYDENLIEEYDDDNIIVIVAGEKALETVSMYTDYESVLGFVLIDPVYPGNMAMSEFGSDFPRQDLAIFMSYDNSKTLNDMPDGKLIYERLSGDDTLYGNTIKHNSRFSSTVYISSNQKNYLSVSAFEFTDDATLMMLNPVFQNEFVQYLGTTYYHYCSDDYKASMVFTRYLLEVIYIICGICGLLLYMYAATRKTDDVERKRFAISSLDKSGLSTLIKVIAYVVLGVYIILILLSYFLIKDYEILCLALGLLPILAALYQYIITKRSGKLIRAESIAVKDAHLVEVVLAFIIQPLLLFLVLYSIAGNNLSRIGTFNIVFALILMILDFFVSAIRVNFGFKTFTKNLSCVLIAVFILLFGVIVVDLSLMTTAAILFMLILVPDFFEGNIRRFTKKTFLYSLTQAVTYVIIALFLV